MSGTGLDPLVIELLIERRRRSMTGRDVTRAMNSKAPGNVSRWERGMSEPTLPNLHAWAAALGQEVVLRPIGTKDTLEGKPPDQTHVVHLTARPVAEDVVWCEECEAWVITGEEVAPS